MKRYVSIDFLKGLSILIMLILHIFINTYNPEILISAVTSSDGSIWLKIVAVIIVYIGSFAGLFFIISGFGNIISMRKQYDRLVFENPETAVKKVRNSIVFRGLLLFFIGYFITAVFQPIILSPIELLLFQDFTSIVWLRFFHNLYFFEVVQCIGLAQIFLGLIYTSCLKRDVDVKTVKKILWGIIIGIFLITPGVLYGIRLIPGFWPKPHVGFETRSFGINLGFFFLNIIGGHTQAIFPWFAMIFIGALIALDLYKNTVTKRFRNKWLIIGSIMFVLGVVLQLTFYFIAGKLNPTASTYFEYGFGAIFDMSAPSTSYMLLVGGGEILAMTLLLWGVEGKRRAKKFAENTVLIRRIGVISLSVYSLQALTIIPIALILIAFGLDPLATQANLWQSLVIIVLCLAIWLPALFHWENINFKWSPDWLFSKIIFRNRKDALKRLNPKEVLYNVEPLGEPSLENIENEMTEE
ncbi:MAG: heparan-alpha-glucosaminide N-acetyltransferase domain-containing protein [Candidatus Heimdallarchaeota archaeon]